MNKMRRKEILKIIDRLNGINREMSIEAIVNIISDIIEDTEFILSEEECYRDNIPENLQGGERFERAEEACDNLEYAIDTLEDIDDSDSFEDIAESIDEAVEYLYDAM